MKSIVAIVCVLFVAAACWAGGAVAAKQDGSTAWHRPQTAAEKTLAKLLRLSETDQNLVEFVLHTPFYKPQADKGYGRYFTKRLLTGMAAMERETVRANCRGKYLEGELCGTEYNPLTCAQDEMAGYLFRTLSQDDGQAVIDYRWPTEKRSMGRYELLRKAGQWKLDRVTCRP